MDNQSLDNVAVDLFAQAMKEKLAEARGKGRQGWLTCPPEELCKQLLEHLQKGDPVDVANFCAFLWNREELIQVINRPLIGKALTRRELEVLRLTSTGKRAKEAARVLNISDATVKTHLANAYGKLDARNRTEAIHLARQGGLL